ncbi:DNA methylase [Vibrio phage 1.170.O._10N.261.52.C3]|nr:DNA methylase [Vibrio phage 1.170.O._10N.261.52.C3]
MSDFRNENVWLMKGDCLERMREIPDNSIDMVLTDPPYGTTRNKWDTVIPLEVMWDELWRLLKPSGVVVLCSSQPFTANLISSQYRFYKYEWVWVKNLKTGNLNARKMPMGGHETLQVFYKKPPTYNPQKRKRTTEVKSGNKFNSKTSNYGKQKEFYEDRQSDWISPDSTLLNIKCVHNSQGKLHPTQKPVELMEYMIKTYTHEGETVLDFTMGSGATIKAANILNRKCIGIENGVCEKKNHKYEGVHWVDVLVEEMNLKGVSY